MMNEFVSIIGGSFFDPIATLLEKLEKHDKGDQPTIKAGYYENAYAISIIILAVASLESYTMRVRYMNNATGKDLDSKPVAGDDVAQLPTGVAHLVERSGTVVKCR